MLLIDGDLHSSSELGLRGSVIIDGEGSDCLREREREREIEVAAENENERERESGGKLIER